MRYSLIFTFCICVACGTKSDSLEPRKPVLEVSNISLDTSGPNLTADVRNLSGEAIEKLGFTHKWWNVDDNGWSGEFMGGVHIQGKMDWKLEPNEIGHIAQSIPHNRRDGYRKVAIYFHTFMDNDGPFPFVVKGDTVVRDTLIY